MAMLAEPRRFRKKYNLVPRGKALFEDDSRFGTKMLERMGWTKGKGLGAREDGSQEFVRIRYKNDANGIGYEDRDDQWTEHEKQFNGLLSSLNNSEVNSDVEEEQTARIGFGFEPTNKDNKVKDKISGESLEEKSKKSKARVHYKKFTKGKDLSQYSEKDLANIFGKKTEETISFQKFEPIVVDEIENCDENFDDSKKFGITTINTGTSVNDYFKLKMEAIKKKRMQSSSVLESTNKFDEKDISEAEDLKKKKEKKKTNPIMAEEQNLHENDTVSEITDKCKKKKKKRKHSEIKDLPVECLEENSTKKKKRKLEMYVENEEKIIENLEEQSVENLEKASMKKSKKKKRNLNISEHNEKIDNVDELDISVNKKKIKNTSFHLETSEIIENIKSKKEKQKPLMLTASTDLEQINDNKLKNTNVADIPENCVSEKTTNSIYIISEFCAEKFRHTDLNRFPGANLSEVIGYGLEKDMKMEIVQTRNDTENITNLWSNVYNSFLTDKYKLYNKCPLKKYAQQVKKAKSAKKKIPKINLKRFKNKSIFKNI